MNMIARKLSGSPTSPVTGSDTLAVLARRLADLDARRREITELIITIEKTSVSQHAPTSDAAQAQALLDGEPFVPTREQPISQLAALYAERDLIDRALKIGRAQHHQLATERAGEVWASHFPEIAKLEKRRVMLALQLQQINRSREVLREAIKSEAGGIGYLPTDSAELLGLGDVHDEVKWAAERLIDDGIATRAEIEKARADG
jgi:hypothetical protein